MSLWRRGFCRCSRDERVVKREVRCGGTRMVLRAVADLGVDPGKVTASQGAAR